jgi:acetyltransferase-like isoleucine patch superfamily enzyme
MMNKIFWTLRGLVYKPFFGRFGFPSYIGKPLLISGLSRIFIGKKVRIFPNARIEVIDEDSSIIIEDNISIGQNLHIISGCNQTLRIGKNSTLSANVFITNIDHQYTEIEKHILDQSLLAKRTDIGQNCFIGYGAVIQAGTILGKQCVVGSNSVVRVTFPGYCVIVGAPAKIIKKFNSNSQLWEKTNNEGEFLNEV